MTDRITLTDEMRQMIESRGDRRMDSYYFGFDPTGDERIDLVLAAVALAGKGYHSTECWTDEIWDRPYSYIDLIQAAANAAAERSEGEQ
jgi:hypothetical protein